jgi:pimeloyl-ACP methyl ester carboxylesterase
MLASHAPTSSATALVDELPSAPPAWASDRVHAVAAGGAHPFAQRTQVGSGDALDWPDISEAVTRSGVPVLLFVGEKDPHCPLCLSYGERSGATVIILKQRDYASTATAPSEFLPQVLRFFEAPTNYSWSEHLPPADGPDRGPRHEL